MDWIHPQFPGKIGVKLLRAKCFSRKMLTQIKQKARQIQVSQKCRKGFDGPLISFLKSYH